MPIFWNFYKVKIYPTDIESAEFDAFLATLKEAYAEK